MLLMVALLLLGVAAAALVGLGIAAFSSAADAFVRSMGGSLQLGGLAYVLHGLTRRGAAHKVPISWRQFATEVRILLGRTRPVGRSATLSAEVGSFSVSGDAVTLRVKRATLEGRVEELERFQQEAQDTLRDLESTLTKERQERTTALQQERSERQSAVQTLQDKIKRMEVGNIYLEWVGVLWIALGIVCATWALNCHSE